MTADKTVTLEEAAAALGFSERHVGRLIHTGAMKAGWNGRARAIPVAEIERFMAERTDADVARARAAIVGQDLSQVARSLFAARYCQWCEDLRTAAAAVAAHPPATTNQAWSKDVEHLVTLVEARREWQAVRALQLALEREAAKLSRDAGVAVQQTEPA